MEGRTSSGRPFGWLWAAYAASALGTGLAFDALPLIAILVLHAGPAEVSALAAAGLAAGAVVAVPLGPWIEFWRKRPVMIAMDLVRWAALASIAVAYAIGRLGMLQLLLVSTLVGAAGIAFTAAAGSYLKALVKPEQLLLANARFEATSWTATMLGPPLGGLAIGLFGPVATVTADAASYLLSALGICAIGGGEARPARPDVPRRRAGDLFEGWRYILAHAALRPLFFNAMLVNGLIMAVAPPLAVLMLGRLHFAPWQYGLAFAAPCIGGLIGARMAKRLVERYGQRRVLLVAGALRACWLLGLAFVGPGAPGLFLVMTVELGLITCMGVFNPVLATYRLERTAADRLTRVLAAWSVTSKASIAAFTAAWGLVADALGPRPAIAIAGALMLGTPLLLFRHARGTGAVAESA